MNAFWGLPTSVATLPTFAAIATATRYGSGFTRKARVLRITTGVTSNAIVSFSTRADNAAVATMSHARNAAWFFARTAIRDETRSKNPQISSPDTSSIMPTRSTITSRLIARSASVGVRTPSNPRARRVPRARARRRGSPPPDRPGRLPGQRGHQHLRWTHAVRLRHGDANRRERDQPSADHHVEPI